MSGFGVELEAALKAPVATVDLTASDVVADVPGDEKRGVAYLRSLPEARARSIRRLAFEAGRTDYYEPRAISEYLRRLPNVSLLEVRDESGTILALLPVSALRTGVQRDDRHALERFVHAVEQEDLGSEFVTAW